MCIKRAHSMPGQWGNLTDQNEEMAVDDEHSEINDDEMIANSVPTHASIKNDLVLNVLAPLS